MRRSRELGSFFQLILGGACALSGGGLAGFTSGGWRELGFALFGTGLGLLVAFPPLRSQERTFEDLRSGITTDRVFGIAARWNDPSFLPAKRVVAEDIRSAQAARNRLERTDAIERAIASGSEHAPNGPSIRESVAASLDFLEELALGVNVGTLDEVLMKRLMRGTVLAFWQVFEAYIRNRRVVLSNHRVYVELEGLAKRWQE
jgi:hypothetical protein